MTKDDVIRLATQAGLCSPVGEYQDWIDAGPCSAELIEFFNLITNQCANICENLNDQLGYTDGYEFAKLIRSSIVETK